MNRAGAFGFVWCAVLGILSGCGKDGQSSSPTSAPVTPEQVAAWGKKVEETIAQGDPEFLRQSFDFEAMAEQAFAGSSLNLKGGALADAKRGFRAGLARVDVAAVFAEQTGGRAERLRFLRAGRRDGFPTAVFRAIGPNGGTDYKEFYLCVGKDGQVRVVDFYTYSLGETVVAMQRRQMGSISPPDSLDQLNAITILVQGGRVQEALDAYAAMPKAVQETKLAMVIRLQLLATTEDQEAYAKAMEDFDRLYPNDPARLLYSVDHYFFKKDFAGVRKSIDELDKLVGGDPNLSVIRAMAYRQEGDLASAKQALDAAIKAEPDLSDAYLMSVGIALDQKDFKEAARVLWHIELVLKMGAPDARAIPLYADFLKSPEGLAWLAAHPANQD